MSNEYLTALRAYVEEHYSVDRLGMPMSEWICANTTLRNRPFSFARFEFQRKIADTLHPNVTVMKPSQVGLTELQIRKALGFLRRNEHTSLIFTFPDEALFKRNSQTRIMPLVESERVFNPPSEKKPVRSMATLQIGTSVLHVMKCDEGEATSTPADFLMHDEVDLSDQNMLGLFQSRLGRSVHKITQRFSTPTFSDFGIDKQYQSTDQWEYMCRCPACNRWQVPVFEPKNVVIPGLPDDLPNLSFIDAQMAEGLDLENARVVCESTICRRPLDLANPELREWVCTYPTRSHLALGLRVRPFSIGDISIKHIVLQLLEYRRQSYVRGWHNTVLGDPYIAGNARLSEAEIASVMEGEGRPEIGRDVPVFLGSDMGQTCHITLGVADGHEGCQAFHFEAVPIDRFIQRVAELRTVYNVVAGCVDKHPQSYVSNQVRDRSYGTIMPVEYRGAVPVNLIKDETGEPSHLQVNRTRFIDDLVSGDGGIRAGRFRMSGYGDQREVVVQHLRDMARDEVPGKPAEWVKLTNNDHYFHSLAFLKLAIRLPYVMPMLTKAETRTSLDAGGADMVHDDEGLFGGASRRPYGRRETWPF